MHISDSYFVRVGIYVETYSLNNNCDTRTKLKNITVQNSTAHALYISNMKSIELHDVYFTYTIIIMNYHYTTAISKLLEDVISSTTPDTQVQFTWTTKVLYPLIENLMLNSLEKWANVILAGESTMTFQQTAEVVENEGSVGGATALFDDSQLLFGPKSKVTFLRNCAQQNGGGVLLHLSTMVVERNKKQG